jgi:hypothetical protein
VTVAIIGVVMGLFGWFFWNDFWGGICGWIGAMLLIVLHDKLLTTPTTCGRRQTHSPGSRRYFLDASQPMSPLDAPASLKPGDGWPKSPPPDPGFAICGGADASERTLRAIVHALLASGVLRSIGGKAWSGQGTWKCCVVCGEPIMPEQLQVEPDGGHAVQSVAHVPCFLAWCDESKVVGGEGRPEEPPPRPTGSPA